MLRSFAVLALCALAQAVIQISDPVGLAINTPKYTVTSPNGAQLASATLDGKAAAPTVTLGAKDTLKLTFQVTETKDGKGVQPHQTFLRLSDPVSGEDGILPVRVTPGGKAKLEINMAKPPTSLPPTTADQPLQATLLLGSYVYGPASQSLFHLVLPASHSAPVSPEEASFHPLPEIVHTFRPEQKLPPKVVSAVFALGVLAPWPVLFLLWSQAGMKTPNLFSGRILPFTALLGAFEVLLLWYWVSLRLGQVLLYGAILAPFTAFAGKTALLAVSERRLVAKK